MAVTKIRKTSSIALIVLVAISVIVMAMFYFGGYVDPAALRPEPTYTGLLLYWTYILFGLAILATVVFGLVSFFAGFRHNPKKALQSLIGIVFLAIVFGVSYAIGSTDKLPLSPDFQSYNVPSWLKSVDMFLFTTYFMLGLCILGVIVGGIKSAFRK